MNFICKLSCRSANSKAQMKRNFRYLWSYPHYTYFCVTVLVLLKCLHVECCTCLQCQFSIFNLNFNVFHETWLVWQIVVLPGWKWRYIENICNINCNPLLHKQATYLRLAISTKLIILLSVHSSSYPICNSLRGSKPPKRNV